ncbi:MAG TPA: hypothetical protein VKU02_12050 [Gemmataceae bacterium]|nr:hypothetical protein [Gemmataceae bacterium]
MNRWLFPIALLLLVSPVIPARARAAPPAKPSWHTDYEQAKALARREGKPMLVVFR